MYTYIHTYMYILLTICMYMYVYQAAANGAPCVLSRGAGADHPEAGPGRGGHASLREPPGLAAPGPRWESAFFPGSICLYTFVDKKRERVTYIYIYVYIERYIDIYMYR